MTTRLSSPEVIAPCLSRYRGTTPPGSPKARSRAYDLSRLQRLRELAMADDREELAERRQLAKELWARLPQYEREEAASSR